jgi:hypothetical protein
VASTSMMIAWWTSISLACRTECCIVKGGEIFLDSATGRGQRHTHGALGAIAVTGVRLDQTGVDDKALTADQSGFYEPMYLKNALTYTPQCPLKCRHYVTESSPKATARIGIEKGRKYLEAMRNFTDVRCFTGGEPLLFYKDMHDLSQFAYI